MSNGLEMNVRCNEGLRRLPIYLLLDCSYSMNGAPIESVRRGLELFVSELEKEPDANAIAYTGIICFNSEASMVNDRLMALEELKASLPSVPLRAEGNTSLGKALGLLVTSIDKHVHSRGSETVKADYRPIVFILTDGKPTDSWEAQRKSLLNRNDRKLLDLVTVGCGPDIDVDTLKRISLGRTFRMDNSDASFKAFFQWVSQSIQRRSKQLVSQPASGEQAGQFAPAPPSLQVVQ